MLYIKPPEIAAKIMSLIDDAENEVTIVSPYNSFKSWDKLKKHFQNATRRNVSIRYYLRTDSNEDFSQYDEIGIQPFLVDNLHAKLYMNEHYAIVSSMNLHFYSDVRSIDLAYTTESQQELSQLRDFLASYVIPYARQRHAIAGIVKQRQIHAVESDYKTIRPGLKELKKILEKRFPRARFKLTTSYIFTSNLIPNFDVMIDETITLKFAFGTRNNPRAYERMRALSKEGKIKFSVEPTWTENGKLRYIKFSPFMQANDTPGHDHDSIADSIEELRLTIARHLSEVKPEQSLNDHITRVDPS